MSAKRWIFAIVSFVAAIGVSLYIVISSWPRQHARRLDGSRAAPRAALHRALGAARARRQGVAQRDRHAHPDVLSPRPARERRRRLRRGDHAEQVGRRAGALSDHDGRWDAPGADPSRDLRGAVPRDDLARARRGGALLPLSKRRLHAHRCDQCGWAVRALRARHGSPRLDSLREVRHHGTAATMGTAAQAARRAVAQSAARTRHAAHGDQRHPTHARSA